MLWTGAAGCQGGCKRASRGQWSEPSCCWHKACVLQDSEVSQAPSTNQCKQHVMVLPVQLQVVQAVIASLIASNGTLGTNATWEAANTAPACLPVLYGRGAGHPLRTCDPGWGRSVPAGTSLSSTLLLL